MFLLYDWLGPLGLGALVALSATGMVALMFFQMKGPPIFRAFLLVLPVVVASFVWSPRPQILSLVLMALVGYILYLYKWKRRNRLWLFVPIFVVWSNLHGGYVLGLILIASMLVGEALNLALGYQDDQVLTPRAILKLLLWGVAAGFAVLVNPNGFQTWLIPFQTVEVNTLQNFVSEWASPDFHEFGQQSFLWLLFACLAAIGLSGVRLDGSDFFALLVFGMMAFVARRNFGPFALVAGPVLARYAWPACLQWWERIHQRFPAAAARLVRSLHRGQQDGLPPRWKKALNLGITGLIAFAAIIKLYVVASPPVIDPASQSLFPVAAVEWIRQNQPPGRMLNSYNWGGYLIWNLRSYPVFVDGRTDLYDDEILNQWMDVVNQADSWRETLDRWEVDLILLEPTRPVVKSLAREGWQLLYTDPIAVVYGR
jgi:hypothetical protein